MCIYTNQYDHDRIPHGTIKSARVPAHQSENFLKDSLLAKKNVDSCQKLKKSDQLFVIIREVPRITLCDSLLTVILKHPVL